MMDGCIFLLRPKNLWGIDLIISISINIVITLAVIAVILSCQMVEDTRLFITVLVRRQSWIYARLINISRRNQIVTIIFIGFCYIYFIPCIVHLILCQLVHLSLALKYLNFRVSPNYK